MEPKRLSTNYEVLSGLPVDKDEVSHNVKVFYTIWGAASALVTNLLGKTTSRTPAKRNIPQHLRRCHRAFAEPQNPKLPDEATGRDGDGNKKEEDGAGGDRPRAFPSAWREYLLSS